MTIEIGNKNTGIPMGSYSPGSGGGGGSVEPPDLSNYYTKQDVDAKLVNKQNTFYTGKALEMKIVTSENVVGFTDNGTTITKNPGLECSFGGMTGSNPNGYTYFYQGTDSKKLDVAISIPIPQKGSPIIMLPMAADGEFALGYYDENGYFIPLLTSIDLASERYPFNCQYCAIGNYLKTEQEQSGSSYYNRIYFDSVRRFYQSASNGAKTVVNTSDEGLTNIISTYGTNGFFQPHRNEDNKIVALGSWAACFQGYGIAMSMDNRVGQDIFNTLDKCTHLVIAAFSDTTFNKKDFGVFETKDRVYWDFKTLHSALSTLENTIDLFSESTTETLVLNTTDNLQISGGALDIGTAVTAQGNTFNGASQLVQLDSDGKLPAIDGSQLTNLSNGSGFPSSVSLTIPNFNNVIEEGMYYWSGYTTPQNHPSGNFRGYLMVMSLPGGNGVKQVFFEADGMSSSEANSYNNMYIRVCISNQSTGYAWGNWASLANSNNISSLVPTGSLKYWAGVETDYTAIETKDADTLYRTTDTNKVFLGTIQIGGNA